MFVVLWKLTTDSSGCGEDREFNAGILSKLYEDKKEAKAEIKRDVKKYINEDLLDTWFEGDPNDKEAVKEFMEDVKVSTQGENTCVSYLKDRAVLVYSIEEVRG